MRNSIIYIFVLCLLCLVSSCVEKEFFEPAQKVEKDTPVVFSAKPKGFTKANVGTRAGEGEDVEDGKFNAPRFENKIYNAYFLLFDNNGLLRIKEKATIDDEGAVSYNIGRDVLSIFNTFRICFIANITDAVYADFEVNKTKWSDLQSYYFDVTYAPISETGCPGVPQKTDLNGDGIYEYAMPMFGVKDVAAPYNNTLDYYSIELVRLFSKVEVHVSLGITRGSLNITSQPQFTLTESMIYNMPLSVPLLPQNGVTQCAVKSNAKVTTAELPSYNLSVGLNRILYSSSDGKEDYRSFYLYVPEHKLGDCGSNSTQSNKPTLVYKNDEDLKNPEEAKNNDKCPTFISFRGFLVGGDGATYDARYRIFFGENETNNFDLSRNKYYKNYVRIKGVSNADHRVEIKKDEGVKDVTRSGQTANCYIIGTAGTYMLPAFKGAYADMSKAEMCEIGEDVVLACDNKNITITIDHNRSKQSTIVFNVKKSGIDLISGNAVIARLNPIDKSVIWSWHLWFIPEATLGNSTDDLGNANRIGGLLDATMYDKTIMADRNIGVRSSMAITDWESLLPTSMIGVYYKYGYRNPCFQDQQYNKDFTYHGFNEADFEKWNGSAKSKTDPCPPGYRVPPLSVWQGSNSQNATNAEYEPIGFDVDAYLYWNGGTGGGVLTVADDIIYPYTYLDSNRNIAGENEYVEYSLQEDIEEKSDPIPISEETYKNRYYYRDVKYNKTRYTDFKYKVPLSGFSGKLLSQDSNNLLHFQDLEFTKNNVKEISEFVSCTKISWEETIQQRRSRYSSTWQDYGDSSPGNETSVNLTSVPELSVNWRDQAANEIFGRFSFDNTKEILGSNTTSKLDLNYGYQVRCIKQ